MRKKICPKSGVSINPVPVSDYINEKSVDIVHLVDKGLICYNGGRLREICWLLRDILSRDNVTLGFSISGALTPAGFGVSFFAPLIKAGWVDYIVSTGANIYHDMHYGLNFKFKVKYPWGHDKDLRRKKIIRIYDILFDQKVLLETDQYAYNLMLNQPEFLEKMGTAEVHYHLARYLEETTEANGAQPGMLVAARRFGVPVYAPAPCDGTLGLNAAVMEMLDHPMQWDSIHDINEITGLAYWARQEGRESAVLVLGGGVPKNYILQTGPQIQEIMGLEDDGHDYFMQLTDAREDTGGLSGATPSEAMTWGKVNPDTLNRNIVCHVDVTIALPIIAAYLFATVKPRRPKRLYDLRQTCYETLKEAYQRMKKERPEHFGL